MAEKKYMIIDGIRAEFTDEKNILQVIHKVGIHVPTFCYYSDMSIYGACRMCVVEDERGGIIASCSTPPKNKMVIKTNTGRLHDYRKMILELLLASHCRDCTVCEKNGNCRLQMLAARFRLTDVRFPNTHPERMIDDSSLSIVRDPSKCILCGDCVRMCNEVQHVGAIDFANRGANMVVTPAFNRKIAETDCVNCGQCAAVCPTAAITIKKDLKQVWQALYAPNKRVVAQVAPAVRVAIGEEFGLKPGKNSIGKIYTALRMCGFDTVFDTSVAADLTIVEEAAELVRKLENGENTYPNGNKYPLFTSCCPGWVKFCENRYPEFRENISTCRSPQAMFGALLKEEARMKAAEAEKEGRSLRKTVVISIMPCTAKKAEIKRPEHFTEGQQDVDYVLTTTEVTRMIKEAGMDLSQIEPEALDMPFGLSSGAAAIFGVTGGVTEAVLRRLVHSSRMEDLQDISFTGIRGIEGIKEASIQLEDRTVKIAVVNGLRCAETLLERIKAGEVQYDFVEVMACKRGCIAGGGQPVPIGPRTKQARLDGMYKIDSMAQIKRSDENPIIAEVYEGILKGKEHKLLHNR